MRTITRLSFATVLMLTSASAQQKTTSVGTSTYRSPDEAVTASVTSTKAAEATPESRIEVRTRNGKVLVHRDYSSEDGEHGYGVTKASWTPDSQFFVYSLESSGGHQGWNSPVRFYSRKLNKILSLDRLLNDAVANPDFEVIAPDKIVVELYFSKKKRTVSLSSLVRTD